ncbi:type II toxin-antitoxin system RelE/ParE family toxin [Rubinisphaera margarita]|uniref:type II toxin-antitoxin system RelE/ParE family toxin n=1 Tax=Rubinisphaera margarita TaxID=2909586 RepID=UPI001EE8408D|nr:type II toxin-antitoxin system RelE/ParE family toxin [Rubinisphaera margarita]MCG6156746.1 type II toxin-antitoxin system RelE/ParE family toxin [Rubinisphaera margarita]
MRHERRKSSCQGPTQWDSIHHMKAIFVETTEFTEWITEELSDEDYSQLQELLMANPQAGDVMKGCGGLRKVRYRDSRRGKGKRSGFRIIYLYIPEAKWFYMLDGYGKDEQDDLSSAERKLLSNLADQLKREARAASGRHQGPKK